MIPSQQMLLGSGANHPATNTVFSDTGPGWSLAGGSLYGNGTMYATIPNDGNFAVGTDNYCIEWWQWMDPNSRGNGRQWQIGNWPSASFGVSIEGYGKNRNFYLWTNGSISMSFTFTNFDYSRWHHWCIVRVNGITTLYYDGVFTTQTNAYYNITESSAPINLFSEGSGANPMAGYIADFHFVKGNYKYSGEFTPSTAPITPITGTVCLLNALTNGTAVTDSSPLNKTVNNINLGWSPRGPYLAPNLWLDGTTDSWNGGTTWHNLGRDDFNAQLYSQMGVVDGAMNFNDYWGAQGAYAYLTGGTNPILANLSNGITVVALYDMLGAGWDNWERIIDFGSGYPNKNILLSRHATSDSINFDIYGTGNNVNFSPDEALAASGKHLVVAYAGPNGTGIVSSTTTVTTTGVTIAPGARTNYYIGKSNWGGDALLQGKIYHLSVFDRVLTTDEIIEVRSALNYKYFPPTLVLNLDAGDTNSYPGTGDTWTDTVSNIAFTLHNSPTYSTDNGGYLSFAPGNSQYADSTTSLNDLKTWTVEAWHYYTGEVNGNACLLSEKFTGNYINYAIGTLDQGTIQAGYYNGWHTTPSYGVNAGNWYHIVGVYDGFKVKMYINGVLVSQAQSSSTPSLHSGAGINLMRRWDNPDFWGGRLAVVRIYDGAMNSDDIVSNFNTGKSRYGL